MTTDLTISSDDAETVSGLFKFYVIIIIFNPSNPGTWVLLVWDYGIIIKNILLLLYEVHIKQQIFKKVILSTVFLLK